MFRISLRVFSNQLTRIGLFSCAGIVLLLAGSTAAAQRSKGSVETPAENQPGFTQFRGVKIGMATEEARKKLGSPKEKSPEQDLFVFNDTEAVNVYYDKGGAVSAITIDYLGGNTSPSLKDIFGSDDPAKSDGSIFKTVRYPKAGFWVSYSRTAGNEPTITITMQKIQ